MKAAAIAASGCALFILAGGAEIAWGRGKPPPSPPPASPDIVYMSSSSYALNKPAIRGVAVTITGDTITSTDQQLLKALDGRNRGSIVWSPDGLRYAWVEGRDPPTAKIMWAKPGKTPSVLYEPKVASDPHVWGGSDTLAWSNACSGAGSVLVFTRASKSDPVTELETEPAAIMGIDIDPATPNLDPPAVHSPRLIRQVYYPNGFAFSPTGCYLVFNSGYGQNEKVSMVSMWPLSPTATTLMTWNDFSAPRYPYACDNEPLSACPCNGNDAKLCYDYPYPAVHSIDWSGDGRRLAMSVTVGQDPNYPWTDLKVAYLDGSEGSQSLSKVERINFDAIFGSASSEHSPQWGSGTANNECERLAFSQSAGASDGSTMNGRRLYLYDHVTITTACFSGPREIAAREPRAIDWK